MKSVTNTKKITKAMEMVSAAKMRRAVEATLSTRPYATMARDLMGRLSHAEKSLMPLLAIRPVNKVLIVLVTANRGLCGSFNSNIYKKMIQTLRDYSPLLPEEGPLRQQGGEEGASATIDLLGIGKKSAWIAKKLGLNLVAAFDTISERPRAEDVWPITKMVTDDFVAETYDKVLVVYTDYKSSLLQVPAIRQVLPVSEDDLEKMVRRTEGLPAEAGAKAGGFDETIFEPSIQEILTAILPRLVEVQIYQAILESAASEHSARMVAMKNATEAAGDMISELRLSFNKARQAAITQEISEIVGGAAALG